MPRFAFAAPLVAVVALSAPLVARAQTLKVGDPAPALTVSKWVKGTPVKSLSDGKVHVVEFWATWCGPCRVTIPHLTQLAAQFKGKADFTGVSIWENDQALVQPFVQNMGAKMDYHIAMDTVSGPGREAASNGSMAKGWMDAADQNGIPTAFVVDKAGKIAWIGHPMDPEDPLDQVLTKVIAGKWDSNAEAAKQAKAHAEEEARNQAMAPLRQKANAVFALVKAGQTDEAMTGYNELKQMNPAFAFGFAMSGLYPALLKTDEPKAYALAKTLSESDEAKSNAMVLNALAWPIVDPEAKLKTPDYALAVKIAEQAVAAGKTPDPLVMDTLAVAYFKNGDKAKAIATEEKAVALLNADPKADAATKKEISDRLAEYKKG